MKKVLSLLLLLSICLLLAACGAEGSAPGPDGDAEVRVSEGFPGGSGTEEDPYLIRSAADLWYLAACFNDSDEYQNPYLSCYYRLEADVDLGGRSWTPLRELRGGFDGAGHTISGFTIRDTGEQNYYAFFSAVSGTLENLTVSSAEIRVERDGSPAAGAIVGRLDDGILRNCRTTNSVSVFCRYQAGGVAASVSGSEIIGEDGTSLVENCVNEARVESSSQVGTAAGIAPYLHGDVSGCVNRGDIVAAGDAAGIACTLAGHVDACENEGSVQAEHSAGGICCHFSDGALNSRSNDRSVYLRSCVNRGSIRSARRVAAGICCSITTGSIQDCRNSGEIRSANEAGGIFGYFQVSAFGTAAEELSISDCVNSGSVSSEQGSIYGVGGIGGDMTLTGTRVHLENCENSGSVVSPDGKYVGGILGVVNAGSTEGAKGSFVNCRNSGEIRGGTHCGGILGCGSADSLAEALILELSFEGCSNAGTVMGQQNHCCVGGITGGSTHNAPVSFAFADCSNKGQLLSEAASFYLDDLLPQPPEK